MSNQTETPIKEEQDKSDIVYNKDGSIRKTMGRPKKEIDQHQFEELCSLQCTLEEICCVLDVTDKTLNDWCRRTYENQTYSEVFRIKRQSGLVSLRRTQFAQSKTYAPMAMFLGKNLLGQKDKVDIEQTNITISLTDQELIEEAKRIADNLLEDKDTYTLTSGDYKVEDKDDL